MKEIIKPETKLKLIKLWPNARKQGHKKGQIWEVGYYCKDCGLDTIWLVDNKSRKYGWTVDKEFIDKHFVIIQKSSMRNLYKPPKDSKKIWIIAGGERV